MRLFRKKRFLAFAVMFCLFTASVLLPASGAAVEAEDNGIATAPLAFGTIEALEEQPDEDSTQASGWLQALDLEDSRIFNYIDRTAFQASGHVTRLKDMEELNTYAFQNRDGSYTVYFMEEDVKYFDSDGSVREKDLSLVQKSGGYGIAQSNLELLMPNNPEDGVEVGCFGHSVKLIPQETVAGTAAKEREHAIVYEGAFGDGTSLKYTPLLSGIKEDIVLSEYTEKTSYDFVLETDGLMVCRDDSGFYLAENSKEEPLFRLGDVVVYDAVGKASVGSMSVVMLTSGERYAFTISVSEAFLSDPETVYPVTIDPTVKVSDSQTDTGSIQDAPIFKGYPNRNFGTYLYNRMGTPSKAYGVGRTAVKLSGLTRSNEYQTISADQITKVVFCVKDASGGASQLIHLYPLTSNKTWTESNVTWNNVGSYAKSFDCGTSMGCGRTAEFDITKLVKAWKNGAYSAEAGFILINEKESDNKSFFSSEFASAAKRPYVVMTYKAGISLNASTASIVEGRTRKLTATTSPKGQKVTWFSSRPAVADVDASGVVTAKKAGSAGIVACYVDADGNMQSACCTVYVCIPNGVYYINNMNSGYCLNVTNGAIENMSDVCQRSRYAIGTATTSKIHQMWKVFYLGKGRYSIRPMHKLNMGLDVTGGNVDIFNIGTKDTERQIPGYAEWGIEWSSTGYVFKNDRSTNKTMQINNSSKVNGATVISAPYTDTANCRWSLTRVIDPPSGVYLYDKLNKCVAASDMRKYILYGSPTTLKGLNLEAVVYSGSSLDQTVTWSSNNSNIATYSAVTGSLLGKSSGTVLLSGRTSVNGELKHVVFYLTVIGAEQYKAGVRVATVNGMQYYDYTKAADNLFRRAVEQCGQHRCKNWEQYCEWLQKVSPLAEPSLSEYEGLQLASFLWFYQQVNHNAVWDIKLEQRWKEALPDVPYLGNNGQFVFRGKVKDAEALGNIMYGYTGRATGFGEITLYWGGGVAAQGSVSSEEVTNPPDYGDSKNDHNNIAWGYELFCSDYPDYPAVGYEGIPLSGWLAKIADVILNPGT